MIKNRYGIVIQGKSDQDILLELDIYLEKALSEDKKIKYLIS